MRYDYDGSGKERELCTSVHTLVIYETRFKSGLIEDVYGKIRIKDTEDDVIADYTTENWLSYARALWAMLKAGADLARVEKRDYEPIPDFDEWSITATNLDFSEMVGVVLGECQEYLFRSAAASSKRAAEVEG